MISSRLSAAGLLAVLLTMVACAADVNLSPAAWSPGERAEMLALNAQFDRDKPAASGAHGVVTGTTGPPAIRAGLLALEQGGTAADAVVTTALTQIALAAGSWVSYAGIYNLVYYDAASGEVFNLNASYDTVRGEDDPASIPAAGASGRTALVPGFMAGIGETHRRFGKLPFASVFAPAIHFAEEGFELSTLHASMIAGRKDVLSRRDETRAIFTKEDGSFYGEGDLFRQPQLAATLRSVSQKGARWLYEGPWAEALVAAVASEGGKMSLEDLREYAPIWQEPVRTTYNGYEIVGHGLPAQGGVQVVEAMNLAEAADLGAMGHHTESAEAFFWLTQISQLMVGAFLDEPTRDLIFGDLESSLAGRLSKENAAGIWERMQAGEFPLTRAPVDVSIERDPRHSDAIVAIDRWGNVAAVVHSINTASWGQTGIFVDGVSIPDSATFQQQLVAEVGPGTRLPDPTEPLIVLRDGEPVAALASIGSGLHQKTLSTLLNLVQHGMDIKSAIDTPSHHLPDFAADGAATQQVIAGEFPDALIERVRAMGLALQVVGTGLESRAPRGYVVGATVDPDGTRRAAAATLLNGVPRGY